MVLKCRWIPRDFRVSLVLSPKERADLQSVILKWVFGVADAFSLGGYVELVPVVVVVRVQASRATLDVGLEKDSSSSHKAHHKWHIYLRPEYSHQSFRYTKNSSLALLASIEKKNFCHVHFEDIFLTSPTKWNIKVKPKEYRTGFLFLVPWATAQTTAHAWTAGRKVWGTVRTEEQWKMCRA